MAGKVLVTGPKIDASAEALLRSHELRVINLPAGTTQAEFVALQTREQCDAIIALTASFRIDAALMDASDRLKVISRHGVGYDNIDVEAATARRLPVLVAPGSNAASVAELSLSLMLALARHILPLANSMRRGEWNKTLPGGEISGKHLGLVGFGHVARRLAELARPFAMSISTFSPRLDPAGLPHGVARRDRLHDLLAESDFVSLHCPLTKDTRHMIGRAELATMKPSAFLINTARGAIVDESALEEALAEGRLAGAGLDVYRDEPLPAGSPLRQFPNVIALPHVGGSTKEAYHRLGVIAAQNVLAILNGSSEHPGMLLNPEVFEITV